MNSAGAPIKAAKPTERKTWTETVSRCERFDDDEEFLTRIVVAVEGILF